METHRPYGAGDDVISKRLDQKAFFKPEKLTDEEQAEIENKYRAALKRADKNIQLLLDKIDSDPAFVFTSDHGEGFGDEGYYFHQPQLRRVDDCLVKVPVVFDGISVDEGPLSVLDIAPTLVDSAGGSVPHSWDGNNLLTTDTDYTITIAPWNEKATVLWQDFEKRLVSNDATVTLESANTATGVQDEVPDELQGQLRDLGYIN
jgi:arylsulfatase A-like enzyme